MSDRNGQFSVIVAGYPREMQAFIESNTGLKRRFLKTIHIDDYSANELMEIFNNNVKRNAMRKKYVTSDELSQILLSFFENWHRSRGKTGAMGERWKNFYKRWMVIGKSGEAKSLLLERLYWILPTFPMNCNSIVNLPSV